MKLRVGSEIVILVDFEVDVSHFEGIEWGLFDGDWVEHFTLVGSLTEQDLVLCEEALRVGVLQVAEGDADRVRAVL